MKLRKTGHFFTIIAVAFLLIDINQAQSSPFEQGLREVVKARYAEVPGFNGKVIINIGQAKSGIGAVQRARTLTTQAAQAAGKSPGGGNYLVLDGIDDYAQRDNVPAIQHHPSDNLTLETWVWLNNMPISGVGDFTDTILFSKFPEYVLYVFEAQAQGFPRATGVGFDYVTKDERGEFTLSINLFVVDIPLKEWVHIAACHDVMSNTVYLALNGSVNVEADVEPPLTPLNDPLTIGGLEDPLEFEHVVNGFIDEVRISKTVRYHTSFEIPDGELEVDADTVALYHFNEP